MNLFGIHWHTLPLPAPRQRRIPASLIDQWQQVDQRIQQTRIRTAQRLHRARKKWHTLRRSGKHYLLTMRKRAQAQTAHYLDQLRREVIQESVQWLVESQRIEQVVAAQLAQKAHQWAIEAVKRIIGSLELPQILLQQLHPPLEELCDHGTLTLRIHAQHITMFRKQLCHIKHLKIVEDEKVNVEQAILESPLLLIKIDIARYLVLLVNQLTQAASLNIPCTGEDTPYE